MTAPEALFDALNAAANGYQVVPAKPRTGEPMVPVVEASTDPEVIRAWWVKWPEAVLAAIPPKPKKITATPFVCRSPKEIPRREFLYGGHLIRKFGSAKFAAGGVGKSSLAITEAIALATNRPLLGIQPRQRCRVWYWNGEDPKEEIERKIAATCLHYEIDPNELTGWLFYDSGREQEIIIAQHTRDGAVIAKPVVEAVIDTILDNKIDVVTIDPFVSSHRVIENDNPATDLVAKQWTAIADKTDCAVELIHHTKKTGGVEATVEDGRGAVALLNAVRSAQVLNKMTADEGTKAGVENHRLYFKVDDGKVNLVPPPEGKDWYKIVSVDLGNGDPDSIVSRGDSVGVVTTWQWPNPLDGLTGADFDKAATAIRAGRWRESQQAKDWVGWAVAGALDIDMGPFKKSDKTAAEKAATARVAAIVWVWIAAGSLIVTDGLDEKRMPRKFVEVASAH
jgi:hypothetical protein